MLWHHYFEESRYEVGLLDQGRLEYTVKLEYSFERLRERKKSIEEREVNCYLMKEY